MSFFHTDTRTEMFVPLINCIINDTLLEAISDIDQALLQFISVVNLVDLLLHFSPCFVVKWVDLCFWVAKGLK